MIKNNEKSILLPISKINVIDNQRWIKKTVKHSEFIGYDTETYKGVCKLIADSTGRHLYNPSFKDCLDFLWFKASYGCYRVFWNMDFDISAILKLSDDIDAVDSLIQGNKTVFHDYILFYLRPKFFQIAKGHKTCSFTDLFFMYKKSLNDASKEFLNKEKIDYIDGNMLNTNFEYWLANFKDIVDYCIRDCKLTADLGYFLLSELAKAEIPIPRYFSSHASLSKQLFRLKCRIPSIKYIPLEILELGIFTYYGGRFEILKRGYFDNLYYYDINSAYPDTIRSLPSLKYGQWIETTKPSKREIIGFYKVLLDIPKSYVSAFSIKHKGLLIFPHGIFYTWITWYELDLLRDYVKEVYAGFEYYPYANKEYYPFQEQIERLYELKAQNKKVNEVFYWIYKIVMNALYGCFIERHKDTDGLIYSGVLFNSIYASVITARTRWKLLKDVHKKNWKYIVAFHTDSLISSKPLPELEINNELGAWSIEPFSGNSGVILATGIYQIGNFMKNRGFSLKDYDYNWFTLLERNFDSDLIEIERTYVIKIAEALRRWKSLENVNIFKKDTKKLNINSDKKRAWKRDFVNCLDVLNNNITSSTLGFKYIMNKEFDIIG